MKLLLHTQQLIDSTEGETEFGMSRHGSTRSNLSSVSSATSYQSFQWQCSADPVEVVVEDIVKHR